MFALPKNIAHKDMRDAFFDELYQIGVKDRDVIVLTNDMDVFSLREFKKNYQDQVH